MLISKFNNIKNANERILELQTDLNIALETKYVDFLIKYNGGVTPDTDICIKRKKYDIRGFFGFDCSKEMYDFDHILQYDDVVECIKKKRFPIACNYYDDFYYLIATSADKNQVILKHHDSDSIEIITDSFNDFVLNGKSKKIGHIRTIEERKNDMIKAGLGDEINDISIYYWQKEIDRYKDIKQELIVL